MKIRASITLPEEILREVDRVIKGNASRSIFIERAIQSYLKQMKREKRNRLDLELLNKYSVRLNREAGDVVCYQGEP